MSDSLELAASEIGKRVGSGTLSARTVVEEHLAKIAEVNDSVNALTVVFADRALEVADSIDQRVARGEQVGSLAGVPFSVKENIDLTWSASTSGCTFLLNNVPQHNATFVDRLLAAGAIPIARANMPDMGLRWDTVNDVFGRTLNPWDSSRVPGGSSGGDAVAIATRMVTFGLGNDYGGSLRLPAYAAGICSLRPTAFRVPAVSVKTEPEPMSLQQFAVNGPLAKRVGDLDLLFSIMHGADGLDPLATTVPHPEHYLGPRRVAMTVDPLGWGVDPQVADAVAKSANALAEAGWEVEEIEPPLLEEAAVLWRKIANTEMGDLFKPGFLPEPLTDGATKYFLDNVAETGVYESAHDYMNAWARRLVIAAAWTEFQAEYPVILGPVSTRRMPEIGYDISGPAATTELWRDHRLLVAVNFLGLPAVALPTGLDADGLPSGVQLIAGRNSEHVALAAARDIEQALGVLGEPPQGG